MADAGEDTAADPWQEQAPVLAGIAAAAVKSRRALGARAGAAVTRVGGSQELAGLASLDRGPCHARLNGFDLHAGVLVRDRPRLERLCRYALRPPLSQERLRLTPEGRVELELRHRWADGTSHLVFEPLELLERLAALTPRPRINLLLYYGVLGARSAWRSRLAGPEPEPGRAGDAAPEEPRMAGRSRTNWLWAELMQRSFGLDVLACPRCGDRLELIALIEDPRVIRRILGHIGLPTELPAARPARSPPRLFVDASDDCPDDRHEERAT